MAVWGSPQSAIRMYLDVPFTKLAVEHGGSKIMANTVAVGAVLGMMKMNLDILIDIIRDTFRKKGEDIIKENINAAKAGHEFAVAHCTACQFYPADTSGAKMLINAIEAIGFGAMSQGANSILPIR